MKIKAFVYLKPEWNNTTLFFTSNQELPPDTVLIEEFDYAPPSITKRQQIINEYLNREQAA